MRLALPIALFALIPSLLFAQDSQVMVKPGDLTRSVDRKEIRIDQRLGESVPLDAVFHDQTNHEVKFGDVLSERPAIVLPIFYRCTGVCNLELRATLDTLKKLKDKKLGRDFDVVVVGIHPKETPDLAEEKFKATVAELQQPGTEMGWRFLVGDETNIRRVTNALGFHYTYDAGRNAIDHPSGIMFLTPEGKISSYIFGAIYTVPEFEKGISLATKNEVGQKATEVFFGCVHVDPITGKRSLVIENVVRLLGVVTLLIMGMSFMVLTGRAKIGRRPTG